RSRRNSARLVRGARRNLGVGSYERDLGGFLLSGRVRGRSGRQLTLAERREFMRMGSSASWILSLLWPRLPWELSSTRLAEPFLWPGLRQPSALSNRFRRLEAWSPLRSFPSPHSPPSSGKGLARSIQGQSE